MPMLKTLRTGKKSKAPKARASRAESQTPTPLKAANLAWDTTSQLISSDPGDQIPTANWRDISPPRSQKSPRTLGEDEIPVENWRDISPPRAQKQRQHQTPPPIKRKPLSPKALSPPRAQKLREDLGLNAASPADEDESPPSPSTTFERRQAALLAHLPKNVDLATATQILNEVIIHGDEVHWSDVAGLDAAKTALKEAVVYPFLRPDLFMGLREPARGMLLFGPPGTGKTMLARAVATESKSTFFAVSASTLTSKWHGESEKLVRALFAIAKRLAPSIIFVDEIDALLGSRGGSGGSEHEASRRTKTEFLIQWSALQKAAAGSKEQAGGSSGDPTRVLVLAATNLPWDIDDAARRRFVRRQYIPLPEAETRGVQFRTLLGHQKHALTEEDIEVLNLVTEGYSGSDITALAKDAAMGPLRNLGDALLHTPKDQIKPITFKDFEASLHNIRPSVSKAGLKRYEDWAREFGERAG